jgi:hypothetical protein
MHPGMIEDAEFNKVFPGLWSERIESKRTYKASFRMHSELRALVFGSLFERSKSKAIKEVVHLQQYPIWVKQA